jgi:FAD:protein FMN transferase
MPASVLNRHSTKVLVTLVLLIISILIAVALQQFEGSPGKDIRTAPNPTDAETQSDQNDAAEQDEPEESSVQALMMLEVTINKPKHLGRRYRRPYVAAWLSDEQNHPVRTILLWIKQSSKGQRWIPDLRQWHRDDGIRQETSDLDLVDAVSGPTRNYGTHKAAWDGNNDLGEPILPGTYTLNVEAAREDGTYQIIREKLQLTDKGFTLGLKGNEEIKSVRVIYAGVSTVAK